MRLAVVLATLAATAGLAYRAFQDELALRAAVTTSRQTIDLADRAITTTADLRAALHAYVAPGQAAQVWLSRSGELVADLQSALASLAGTDGAPLAPESMTRLVAAEKRARAFVRDNQELLAADVVFSESRDHFEAIRQQLAGVRERAMTDTDAREAALRREQALLAGGIVAAWLLCALMLVPVAAAPVPMPAPVSPEPDAVDDMHLVAPPPPPLATPEPIAVKPAPLPPVPRLPEAAQVCADFARASDGAQIGGLLVRAADVLDATGLIVWVASADAGALVPAASCGYDERMLTRIGSLPRSAENLTAAAFRDGARRTSSARSGAPAAIAVPLVGPNGPIGVLSGEIRHVERVGETTAAIASIFAAQLATLVSSMPPAEPAEPAEPLEPSEPSEPTEPTEPAGPGESASPAR
jgi:hypothetical protein